MISTANQVALNDLAQEFGHSRAASAFAVIALPGDYMRCLDLAADGDPAWDEEFGPHPILSGQWADDPTPTEVAAYLGNVDTDDDELVDEIADFFESAFYVAYADEVIAMARRVLHAYAETAGAR